MSSTPPTFKLLNLLSDDNLHELIRHFGGVQFALLLCCSKELQQRLKSFSRSFFRSHCQSYFWFLGDRPEWTEQQWIRNYLHLQHQVAPSVLAIGGSSNRNLPGEDQWLNSAENLLEEDVMVESLINNVPSLTVARDATACCRDSNHTLWISGGWNGSSCHQSIECLTSVATDWVQSEQTLFEPRCFHAALFDQELGHLVLGGSDHLFQGAKVSNTVELPAQHQLFPCQMIHSRTGHIASINPLTRIVVVCGGYGGGNIYHHSVEMIDLNSAGSGSGDRGFVTLPNMRFQRTGSCGGFGPDGSMYVCGGSTDGSDALSSVERLDIRTRTWEELPSMAEGRGYTGGCWGADGCLYVCGGSELRDVVQQGLPGMPSGVEHRFWQQVTSDTIERYDPRMNKWETLSQKLSLERADHCVVARLMMTEKARASLERIENPVVDVWQSRGMRTL